MTTTREGPPPGSRKPNQPRSTYREMLRWIIGNTDCSWLRSPDARFHQPATVVMIREVLDLSENKIINDLRRELRRRAGERSNGV